jgi:hypothetical protein
MYSSETEGLLIAWLCLHKLCIPTVVVIPQVGSELVAAGNFHGEEVREIVQSLSQEWKQLSSASAKKG